jgi:hypothetical protein
MVEAGDADRERRELLERIGRLQVQLQETRAWCASLEQQQAQLAAVLALISGPAGRALTRFPLETLSSPLLDQLAVHGEE